MLDGVSVMPRVSDADLGDVEVHRAPSPLTRYPRSASTGRAGSAEGALMTCRAPAALPLMVSAQRRGVVQALGGQEL